MFRIPVKSEYECNVDEREMRSGAVKIPELFRNYLDIGTKVCSAPALDRRFKTIDFLVLFDINTIDPRGRKLFFGG